MNKRTLNTRLADFWYWLARNTSTGITNRMYGHYLSKLNCPYWKSYNQKPAGYWTELVR